MPTTKEMTERGLTSFQNKVIRGSKIGTTGAALLIGTTSILDFGMTANRNRKARQETERRNKQLEEDAKNEQKARRTIHRRESVNAINLGQTVVDMFNDRTGHHQMGNSRF